MQSTMTHWEHFSHEADIGVRGIGITKEEAFMQAAYALTAIVVSDLHQVQPQIPVDILCQAPDDETLLVDWLNALIYEMAVRKMLFSHFEINIHHGTLKGRIWGENVDIIRHQPAAEPKGATYTALKVAYENNHWIAQCVVDV